MDLIYDLGMNDGADSAFYLAKGFRVVAVEAAADLCEAVKVKEAVAVADGRLIIENLAVVAERGPVTFYTNEKSVWGTTEPGWAKRNAGLAHAISETVTVSGVLLRDLIVQHGTPYYLKIDIEGADMAALEDLRGLQEQPTFVSIESNKVSWSALEHEFDVLVELGYRRFKVVPQQTVNLQRPPRPAREGVYVPWRFRLGDSGLFGEEAPGAWLTCDQAINRYRRIFRRYRYFGDDGTLVPPSIAGAGVRRYLAGWYDTHAGR